MGVIHASSTVRDFVYCLSFFDGLVQVFTHALFDLTSHPSYIITLREEAEQVFHELEWTKAALNQMQKIDTFFRESQRVHDNGPGNPFLSIE